MSSLAVHFEQYPTHHLVRYLVVAILIVLASANSVFAEEHDPIIVTAGFTGRELTSRDEVELTLNRPLLASDGRLAITASRSDRQFPFRRQGSRSSTGST
ncbi:MAG: hypothetical protein AB7P09_19140 [Pyrinomonadaceae bacterium]